MRRPSILYPSLLESVAELRRAFGEWKDDPDTLIPDQIGLHALRVFNLADVIGYPLAQEAPDVAKDVETIVAAVQACRARRKLDGLAAPSAPESAP